MQSADKVVELAQTRFSWPGAGASVVALPALSVTRGERVFLRGPSGSGKSTLLNLLAGVLPAPSGSLRVLGQDLSRMPGVQRLVTTVGMKTIKHRGSIMECATAGRHAQES